ncbi:hypothetical protein LCI18_007724 [Fusarium solani-melongenae]|uniref:Uncharacterized protein n=1 Tax=Fusarium solani subsp. cucurbitae TaxID=2747967 RepID=A0ACD3Z695_FUSSC|nr:hypothetical protein LCI18_007724 [Fusarium solani-melongenae]
MGNIAILAGNDGQIVVDRNLPKTQPATDEILIEVLYSGVNPADTKLLQLPSYRHKVLGNEFCGRVIEVSHLADTSFKIGDLVAGQIRGGDAQPTQGGTHQSYISIVPDAGIFRVPDHIPPQHAAGLAVTTQTASDGLFNQLLIPIPSTTNAPVEGTLLIWGGATGVGMAAIQLARSSGLATIIAIASPERHELLKDLGATYCFDYKDKDVVQKIQTKLHEIRPTQVWGFDAAAVGNSSGLLAEALAGHPNVRLASVSLAALEPFRTVLGARHYDLVLTFPGASTPMRIPARPMEAAKLSESLSWVLENYGSKFKLPVVRTFHGTAEEAAEEIYGVGQQKIFGKLTLEHPLN